MIQYIIVSLAILGAIAYASLRISKTLKRSNPCDGCAGCSLKSLKEQGKCKKPECWHKK